MTPGKPSSRLTYLLGLAATLVMGVPVFLARVFLGIPSLPELLESPFLQLLPPGVFAFLIDTMGYSAKPLLFLGLLGLQFGVGGFLGQFYLSPWRSEEPSSPLWRRSWGASLSYTGLLWAITTAGLLPLVGAGVFGSALPSGPALTAGAYLVSILGYSLALESFARLWLPGAQDQLLAASPTPQDRRLFLKRATVGLVTLLSGGVQLRLLAGLMENSTFLFEPSRIKTRLTPEVTSNEAFYVVSKNFFDPTVDPTPWRLEIKGLVSWPFTLTLPELRALPAVEEYVTLECISNELGGDLMGNALWRGVPLRELLERAGYSPRAKDVACFAVDDYSDSIPLAKALHQDTLVAYEMNGSPLPPQHGFPVRLIVPGIYGMKHVKWLKAIQVVDYDFKGYWEKQGWSDEAIIKTTSRYDVPKAGSTLALAPNLIGGVAFAGERGIARVEFSFDEGKTWVEATLKEALSPYTWVLWWQPWDPPRPGEYVLLVRATDQAGALQIQKVTGTFPDGATGFHTLRVRAV